MWNRGIGIYAKEKIVDKYIYQGDTPEDFGLGLLNEAATTPTEFGFGK